MSFHEDALYWKNPAVAIMAALSVHRFGDGTYSVVSNFSF